MAVSVDDIIARLGGAEAAAKKLGVGTEAVRKWRQTHSIPARPLARIAGPPQG